MSSPHSADDDYIRKLARCRMPLEEIAELLDTDADTIAKIVAADPHPPAEKRHPIHAAEDARLEDGNRPDL